MKIVITDHRFPDLNYEELAVKSVGGTLVVGQVLDESKLVELCRDADAVLTARAPITATVIAAMNRCRIIVRYGIGVDTIDVAAATERGIPVAAVPDYCLDEVSDHALGLLLTLSRQIVPATALAKEESWGIGKMPSLRRLRGQICGLVGCGKIGSLLARKAMSLGMRIVVCDPYLSDDRCHAMGLQPTTLDGLLESSDFISLHAPLNRDTYHMFGEGAFDKMKSTSSIINTSRGGLIDEPALLAALDSGKILGAALDVLESESSVTATRKLLVNHPKVIVTPHSAWFSEEARASLQKGAVEQVLVRLNGEIPYGLINPNFAK
jgi:D-3-phosphoglycerate dehydrogenase / 2-oxoglutarate reductase